MKIEYEQEHDILNIEFLSDTEIVNSVDHNGVVIDYGENNRIVAIEVLDASKRIHKDPLDLINFSIVRSSLPS